MGGGDPAAGAALGALLLAGFAAGDLSYFLGLAANPSPLAKANASPAVTSQADGRRRDERLGENAVMVTSVYTAEASKELMATALRLPSCRITAPRGPRGPPRYTTIGAEPAHARGSGIRAHPFVTGRHQSTRQDDPRPAPNRGVDALCLLTREVC